MTEPADELRGLSAAERGRLERFAAAFEHLDASRYATFTETSTTPEVEAAQREAVEIIGSGPRQRAVRAAVMAFVDAASAAYSGRMSLPDTFLLFQSLPDRPADRVRFLASVERAVVGLILWEELPDDARYELIGPWLAMIEGAV
jgi:hypothetical protein